MVEEVKHERGGGEVESKKEAQVRREEGWRESMRW